VRLAEEVMVDGALHRFFGGAPAAVLVRLVFLSLVVGALMMWLDINPLALIEALEAVSRRVWAMGFDAVREVGRYVAAGALVVVPIWFLARLFSFGASR
jgi:hypothetical protein